MTQAMPNRPGGEQLIAYLIGLTQRFGMKTGQTSGKGATVGE